MAPWSLWSQSTSQPQQQQQQQQQELPPPTPASASASQIASKTADPSGPTSAPSSAMAVYPTMKTRTDHTGGMPSSTELWQIGKKSLVTGLGTGALGIVFGGYSEALRSSRTPLFKYFAGFQWFMLGSSYMASRRLLIHAWGGDDKLNSSDIVKVGGVSGGVSGLIGGMIRGPRNILPAILVFSSLGAGGSFLLHLSQRAWDRKPETESNWLGSKWSPLQKLSDEDYMAMLEEKILKVDAEIAIIDESIASLKESLPSSPEPKEPTKK